MLLCEFSDIVDTSSNDRELLIIDSNLFLEFLVRDDWDPFICQHPRGCRAALKLSVNTKTARL